ncbi:MAG: hypothetical protein NVS3B10_09720 [Polyangiales bacterium]
MLLGPRTMIAVLALAAAGCAAAAPHGETTGASLDAGGGDEGGFVLDAAADSSPIFPFDADRDAPHADAGAACEPPDVLVILDHTLSMAKTPTGAVVANTPAGHAKSKWSIAVGAVKALSAPPIDKTIRFGLELLPHGAPGCVTLDQILTGTSATNAACQPGEVVVPPDLEHGAAIAAAIDVERTPLCITTPIALALDTATTELEAHVVTGRRQAIVLVTDGGETCKGPVVASAQALFAKGISTYVVGFGAAGLVGDSGVNVPLLNDAACAGGTAQGAATACTKSATGSVATNPTGPPIFFLAQDAASLSSALATIAGTLCCHCVK